jgi:hypothetical protein
VALTYGYLSRRHVLTVGLFLLGWSGVGLERLADWLAVLLPGRSGARKPDAAAGRRRGAVHGVLLALAVGALLPFALAAPDRDHLPLKRLGLWIRERSGPGRRIAPLGYPRVCYYAGGTLVEVLSRHQAVVAESPPPGALEALGAALSRGDVEIVIQSSRQPAGLRRWLDTVSAPLHRVENPEKQRWWCARSLDSR